MKQSRVTFDLPTTDWDRLRVLAEKDRRSLSSILRLAVEAYLRIRRVPETETGDGDAA